MTVCSYPWRYDESVQVGTDYRSEEEVRAYDQRMRTLRDIGSEVADIRRALALRGDSVVWEIGTGTGECALALAPGVRHVYATDVSPAMLACGRSKGEHRHIANVTFAAGGFLSGFRPEAPVDSIVSQLALHHLPDFWKQQALVAIARQLRPGGRFYLQDVVFPSAITEYDPFFETVVDGVRAKAGEEVARQTIEHIKEEFSTLDWILEGMIARSGLKVLERDNQGFLSVYVCEKAA